MKNILKFLILILSILAAFQAISVHAISETEFKKTAQIFSEHPYILWDKIFRYNHSSLHKHKIKIDDITVLNESDGFLFFKSKNNIYFYENEDHHKLWFSEQIHHSGIALMPYTYKSSFEYLGGGYIRISNKIYHIDKEVSADVFTFKYQGDYNGPLKVLDKKASFFARDEKHIFFYGKTVWLSDNYLNPSYYNCVSNKRWVEYCYSFIEWRSFLHSHADIRKIKSNGTHYDLTPEILLKDDIIDFLDLKENTRKLLSEITIVPNNNFALKLLNDEWKFNLDEVVEDFKSFNLSSMMRDLFHVKIGYTPYKIHKIWVWFDIFVLSFASVTLVILLYTFTFAHRHIVDKKFIHYSHSFKVVWLTVFFYHITTIIIKIFTGFSVWLWFQCIIIYGIILLCTKFFLDNETPLWKLLIVYPFMCIFFAFVLFLVFMFASIILSLLGTVLFG